MELAFDRFIPLLDFGLRIRMSLLKPFLKLAVSPEKSLQRFSDDVIVCRVTEEFSILLEHRVRLLVEPCRHDLLFLLGFNLRNQRHGLPPVSDLIQILNSTRLRNCRRRSNKTRSRARAVATPEPGGGLGG